MPAFSTRPAASPIAVRLHPRVPLARLLVGGGVALLVALAFTADFGSPARPARAAEDRELLLAFDENDAGTEAAAAETPAAKSDAKSDAKSPDGKAGEKQPEKQPQKAGAKPADKTGAKPSGKPDGKPEVGQPEKPTVKPNEKAAVKPGEKPVNKVPPEKTAPQKGAPDKTAPDKTAKPGAVKGDGGKPDKANPEKGNPEKTKPEFIKPENSKVGAKAGNDEAALAFARQHHPELADLLVNLKKGNPNEYGRAIKELSVTVERLSRMREKAPERYDSAVAAWTLDSKIRLLSARLVMADNPALEAELKALLQQRREHRLQEMKQEREKVAARLKRLETDIAALEADPAAGTQKELLEVQSRLKEKAREFRRKPGKPGTPETTKSSTTKSEAKSDVKPDSQKPDLKKPEPQKPEPQKPEPQKPEPQKTESGKGEAK